jgi:hypothetical protein
LWKFTHPISGTHFQSFQINALKASIWSHEENNGYERSTEEAIENQLCQNHPASCGVNPPVDPETRRLAMADIVRGTKVIAKFKLAGSPLVTQEHAEKRAYLCSTCKKNVNYTKPCSGICQELIDLVEGIVGGAKTTYDDSLKACAVCACSNAAQVHVPAEFLALGVTDAMMAEFNQIPDCWKAKELRELKGAPA